MSNLNYVIHSFNFGSAITRLICLSPLICPLVVFSFIDAEATEHCALLYISYVAYFDNFTLNIISYVERKTSALHNKCLQS